MRIRRDERRREKIPDGCKCPVAETVTPPENLGLAIEDEDEGIQ